MAVVSNNETTPMQANPTPTTDQAAAAVRTVLLCIGVITALAGFVAKRDLAGFITYMQSSEFAAALGLLLAAATFAWGQWKTRHRAKQLATVAADPRVPDEVISLKGSEPQP